MNNLIADINNESEMEMCAKIPVILNTLSFYAGRFYRRPDILLDTWQQKKNINLLDIKHWFEERLKNKEDLLKPKGFEQRVINIINQVPDKRLKNIVLTDFSLTDNNIKENLNNGTNVYRFYDLENKCVYYASNSSMPGEFSGGVVNALCGQGENKPGNKVLYSGLDIQDFLAFACERYFSRKHKNTDLSDENANKIFFVGYSFGGHKALCSIFLEAMRLGEKFDFNKYACVSINGLGLADKTINFFKEQLGDRFDKVASKILNIAGSSDVVYPYTKNFFGQEIFFDSESKKGIFGHDITSLDLNKKIDKNKLGFKFDLFKEFHRSLEKYKTNYKLCYTVLVLIERLKGIKFDVNGNKTKIGFLYSVYAIILCINLFMKSLIKTSFYKLKKSFSRSKKNKKQIKTPNEIPSGTKNISNNIDKLDNKNFDRYDKNQNKDSNKNILSRKRPFSKLPELRDKLNDPDQENNLLR